MAGFLLLPPPPVMCHDRQLCPLASPSCPTLEVITGSNTSFSSSLWSAGWNHFFFVPGLTLISHFSWCLQWWSRFFTLCLVIIRFSKVYFLTICPVSIRFSKVYIPVTCPATVMLCKVYFPMTCPLTVIFSKVCLPMMLSRRNFDCFCPMIWTRFGRSATFWELSRKLCSRFRDLPYFSSEAHLYFFHFYFQWINQRK